MTEQEQAEWLKSFRGDNPAPVEQSVEQRGDLWGNLGAGGYSAVNSVLMGLPDLLVKTVGGKKGLEELKRKQAAYKAATTAGDIAGLGASFLIPGGAILKGAGALAKGAKLANVGGKLTKAGNLAAASGKGLSVGKTLAKGAITGAEQAIPRAVIEGATTEDWGQAGQNALLGTALGGGLGLAGKGLGAVAGKGAQGLKQYAARKGLDLGESAEYALAGTMGLNGRAVRRAMKFITPGNSNKKLEKVDEAIRDFNRFGVKYGLTSAAARDDVLGKVGQKLTKEYDDMTRAAMQANPNLKVDVASAVLKATEKAEGVKPEVAIQVARDISKYGKGEQGLIGLRNSLSEDIRRLMESNVKDEVAIDRLRALHVAKETLDEQLDKASGGALKQLGKEYRAFKMAQDAELYGKFGQLSAGSAGSTTFEKLMAGDAASRLASGAGLGALSTGADVAQGKDVDWGKAIGSTVAGSIAGPAAAAALRKGGQKLLSKAAPKLEALEPKLEAAANLANKPLPEAGKIGQALAGAAESGALPKAAGILAGSAERTEGEPVEASKPGVMMADGQAEAPAGGMVAPVSVIESRLQALHDAEYPDVPMDEFVQRVTNATNGFTDKAQVAKFLADSPEQAEKLARQFEINDQLKSIDTGRALKGPGGIIFGIGADKGAEAELAKLRYLMLQGVTGGDPTKASAADEKRIIASLKEAEKNPELLPTILKAYGIDLSDLQAMGVV